MIATSTPPAIGTPAPVQLTADEQIRIDRDGEKQLTRTQGKYRDNANNKTGPRINHNQLHNEIKNLKQLQSERCDVRTRIAVASGRVARIETDNYLATVELHVHGQEFIQRRIDTVHRFCQHIDRKLKRVDAARFECCKVASTDQQYDYNLRKAQRTREVLENRLETRRQQECQQIAVNARLRAYIEHQLSDRARFHQLWQRMVHRLGADKKFLVDMVDRAALAFNRGATLCGQLDEVRDRNGRDRRSHITEMIDMIRKLDADDKLGAFLRAKGDHRELSDLEAREYARRQRVRDDQAGRARTYKQIIDQVVEFQQASTVGEAVEKFQRSDGEYFAHFNYMNHLNFQVEFLDECLQRTYTNIDALRSYNQNKELWQLRRVAEMTALLKDRQEATAKVERRNEKSAERLRSYMATIDELFGIMRCSRLPKLDILLGYQQVATVFNVDVYLAQLEVRLDEILKYVYHAERAALSSSKKAKDSKDFTVRGVERDKREPTAIEDVVLVQQCAECAEGEVNRYDEEIVYPIAATTVREKVRVKTQSPEIQYRLHRLSACRLPRSRALVNKRFL